jgi:[acyl-carrier-protein] S-malonyltransferase
MIAFTFPGQGSQKPGMGEPWTDHPSWELVAEAAEATDRDVEHLLLRADAEELKATRNAQLATFVTSLVVLDSVERLGVEPAAVAGHSLGEYTALVAAGALSFEDGAYLVTERGEAMQATGRDRVGTMAAVLGLDDDDVDVVCARVAGDVWVANYNAPGQVVIAGSPEAIDEAATIARELGAKKVMPVAVSGAFHTPFMAPAQDRLRKALARVNLRPPEPPVHANVDSAAHDAAGDWTSLLDAQLCKPVRWRQTLHRLKESGVNTFVELGPGKVLTGMAKRTVDGARTLSVSAPDDLDRLLEQLDACSAAPIAASTRAPGDENLFVTDRLIVSPSAGIFTPLGTIGPGTVLEPGQILGRVADHDVRSPFAGRLVGLLADPGEPVTRSRPLARLRVT